MVILTHEDFSPHLNTVFRVSTPGLDPQDLELVEVSVSQGPLPEYLKAARVPFLLIFRGPPAPMLPEQIHQFRHPAMGDQEIYIIPLGPLGRTDAFFYQAVFN